MRFMGSEFMILNEEGVDRITSDECVVWEDDEHVEVLLPRPMIAKQGDLWVVRARFEL